MPRGLSIKYSFAEDGEEGEMKSLGHQARLCETVFEQTKKIYIFVLSGHDSPVKISPWVFKFPNPSISPESPNPLNLTSSQLHS